MAGAVRRSALALFPIWAVICAVLGAAALPAHAPQTVVSASGPQTPAEQADFLRTAEIVRSRSVSRGVTGISRLTLSNGAVTHDAAFQSIDERRLFTEFARGGGEVRFADSYHFNIAGYRLAGLLGLDHMVPVTVERRWRDKVGALSWWVDAAFDERERIKRELSPPDTEAWNRQMHRVRVFSALIYDTDRNLGNILITEDWKIWMIDFSRAFRPWKKLLRPDDLQRCDRRLLERLEQLTAETVREAVGNHLRREELDGLMARRDLIVARIRQLVAERGEQAVLY